MKFPLKGDLKPVYILSLALLPTLVNQANQLGEAVDFASLGIIGFMVLLCGWPLIGFIRGVTQKIS